MCFFLGLLWFRREIYLATMSLRIGPRSIAEPPPNAPMLQGTGIFWKIKRNEEYRDQGSAKDQPSYRMI
jgi:hypothetical protein